MPIFSSAMRLRLKICKVPCLLIIHSSLHFGAVNRTMESTEVVEKAEEAPETVEKECPLPDPNPPEEPLRT